SDVRTAFWQPAAERGKIALESGKITAFACDILCDNHSVVNSDCAQNLVVMRWRYYATHRYNAPGHEPHWQIFSEPYLRLVEFGAGDGGKGPPALVEGLAAREQHLSIQKHGHGFTHA